ncbi:hypothetical protein [Dyadobacter arcticus]|uniref:Uncharacterized protein n=1 Tax=Dyadobacter arcticus TaxID=1078754 RepID=A0ABX0UNH8_9BACT|nr:hypothetical protein [Dyadobacter arcticus]NIJ54542.1 hypothetical protein [Dyadobacter arcticus]
MKTTYFMNGLCQRLSRTMALIVILATTMFLAPFAAEAENNSPRKQVSSRLDRNLGQQIGRYIKVENSDLAELEKGIIVISFSLNEKNQLSQVVSHSQIPAVDLYIKSNLEGKTVEIAEGEMVNHDRQYVKLRFFTEE